MGLAFRGHWASLRIQGRSLALAPLRDSRHSKPRSQKRPARARRGEAVKLVSGGPDIPYKLLTAQEEGRLIFFCGAGVSMKAGLPDFKGLIMNIYSELRADIEPKEEKEIRAKAYERVIELLDERFGYQKIRGLVSELLHVPPNPDLSVHSAILKLSENRENQYKEFATRLVTTNFDLLFEEADNTLESLYAPPSLDNWSGIVHLHGKIGASSTLVLNSAEFGDAYVLNGATSRFVYDLIRKYTILFVGYGIGDPVVQYLFKALSAGRQRGEEIQKAYALLSREPDSRDDGELSGVTPIYYNSSGEHELLHKSLDWWAKSYSGGLRFKIDTMRRVAERKPSELDYEKEHLFWAIQDSRVANKFAKLGKQVDFAWCDEFDKAGLLNAPKKNENALIRKLHSPDLDTELDPIRCYLAAWISGHIADPVSLHWVMSKGSILHEKFKDQIQFQLKNSGVHPKLRSAWEVLSGIIPLNGDRGSQRDEYSLLNRINREEWNPKMRIEILDALSPCLEFSPLGGSYNQLLEWTSSQEELIACISHSECVLRCRNIALEIHKKFVRQEYRLTVAIDFALGLTELLRRAMDMQAIFESASETHDLSTMKIARITEHPRDIELNSNSWIILVWLLWRAFKCVREESLEAASTLVDIWRTHRYPVFRRLILAAASQGAKEEAS